MRLFDKFKRLTRREVVLPPIPAPAPSPIEDAQSALADWVNSSSDSHGALRYVLDSLQLQAELTENTSLANQPLMLFHHGRVAAFKELKALLDSLRRQAPSGRTPQ